MARFFLPIRNLLQSFLKLDLDTIALEITRNNTFQSLVIKLNTEGLPTSQLFNFGEDSLGKKLSGNTIAIGGEYTPFTKQKKQEKGQPTDRITLKDTGAFYMSFKIIPFKGGFEIDADGFKKGLDGGAGNTDLFEEFGEDVLGLNNVNLQTIIEFYKNAIQEKVNQKLRAA